MGDADLEEPGHGAALVAPAAPAPAADGPLGTTRWRRCHRLGTAVCAAAVCGGCAFWVYSRKGAILQELRGLGIDSGNPWHWAAFFCGGLLCASVFMVIPYMLYVLACAFYLGLPAFPLIYGALFCGMTVNFALGRLSRSCCGTEEADCCPKAAEHVRAVRSLFVRKPVQLSFWFMFAPIPVALNFFLCARFTDVPYLPFAVGATLQKWPFYAPMIVMAAFADNLSDAFSSRDPARLAGEVVGAAGVLLGVICLTFYGRRELRRFRAEQAALTLDACGGEGSGAREGTGGRAGDSDEELAAMGGHAPSVALRGSVSLSEGSSTEQRH